MFYLGIDVAKAKLDCCLLLSEAGSKRRTKVVPNSKAGVAALLEWSAKLEVPVSDLHVIMEATGVYHERVALLLIQSGAVVSVINPAQARNLGRGLAVRTKTDKVDSCVLARFGALLKPTAWQPPSPEARMLSSLLARRDAVAEDLRREKNRLEKTVKPPTRRLVSYNLFLMLSAFMQWNSNGSSWLLMSILTVSPA